MTGFYPWPTGTVMSAHEVRNHRASVQWLTPGGELWGMAEFGLSRDSADGVLREPGEAEASVVLELIGFTP